MSDIYKMRGIILLMLLSLGFVWSEINTLENFAKVKLEDGPINISTIIRIHRLVQEIEHVGMVRDGGIVAIINDYADEIFKNVQKLIIRNGLDPVELPDQDLKLFPTGSISLTEGWLEDTATIARYKNVSVSYSSFTKKLSIAVPIQFSALMSIYKYHGNVFILNWSGNVQGKIEDVRANIQLGFDFNTYEASVETFDIKESGSISLTFSGNGLLDWVTTRMTAAITFFLHPVILTIIEFIVKGGVESAVKATNEAINNTLYHDTTTTAYNTTAMLTEAYLYI